MWAIWTFGGLIMAAGLGLILIDTLVDKQWSRHATTGMIFISFVLTANLFVTFWEF